MPISKRTIKLKKDNAQGQEFIKVNNKNKTSWASCYKLSGAKFLPMRQVFTSSGGLTLTSFETNLLFGIPSTIGAILTSAAIATPYTAVTALRYTVIYKNGKKMFFKIVPLSIGRITTYIAANPARAAAFAGITSFLETLGFLSAAIKTPEMTNFNKPCSDDPGQGKF